MAQEVNRSMSLSNPHPPFTDGIQKLMAGFGGVGLLMMLLASVGNLPSMGLSIGQLLTFSLVLISIGTIGYAWRAYLTKSAGIKNDGVWFSGLASRGVMGWTSGIVLTGFYVLLYWFPQYLGQGSDEVANSGLVAFFDPLSQLLKGQPASQWFVYGTLYTIAILIFGIKFIWKYRHNKYQVLRTISVMFFQLGFAYLIPEFMANMNVPYNDMKNMWPLNYYFFDDWNIKGFIASGGIGLFMLILGIAMIFVISPILTYKYGKRWYCSWVCGCGGLAETAGDPFRHLSDKSLKAWQIERWLIHLVLLFSIIMTVAVVYSLMHNNPETFWINKTTFMFIIALILLGGIVFSKVKPDLFNGIDRKAINIFSIVALAVLAITSYSYFTGQSNAYMFDSYKLRSAYGFYIGAAFSGVIGVGFYPLMGSRVWCRFGCPMAAILGIQQKLFSKFRITTNGGQCISCGNCSTYCEMGIDVRSYAQKGQNIVRASCVGCGICAAVCPRGVLRLENGSGDIYQKTDALKAIHINANEVGIL